MRKDCTRTDDRICDACPAGTVQSNGAHFDHGMMADGGDQALDCSELINFSGHVIIA